MEYSNLLVFESVAEMQASPDFKHNQIGLLLGASSVGDGGGPAWYRWDKTSTATDTSSTTKNVIKATNEKYGRWLQIGGAKQVNLTADATLSGLGREPTIYTLNAAAGLTVTLPAATGSGKRAEFVVGTTVTSNSYIIQGDKAAVTMYGNIIAAADGGNTVNGWEAVSDADTITLDGSTTGGIVGDRIICIDIAADTWLVVGVLSQTGTEATPFSNAIT